MEAATMKKKKGGRPTKKLKRELRVTARFSRLEHHILQQRAGKAGINISELIRQAAIYGKVIARQTEEEKHLTRQLVGMANNFNQMTKLAHQEGLAIIHRDFEQYLQLANRLLSQIQHGE